MKRVPIRLLYGWTPPGTIAWVPRRRTIVIQHGIRPTIPTIAHELAHVMQFERLGALRYYLAYFMAIFLSRFRRSRHWMEVAAYEAQKDPGIRAWAARLLERDS